MQPWWAKESSLNKKKKTFLKKFDPKLLNNRVCTTYISLQNEFQAFKKHRSKAFEDHEKKNSSESKLLTGSVLALNAQLVITGQTVGWWTPGSRTDTPWPTYLKLTAAATESILWHGKRWEVPPFKDLLLKPGARHWTFKLALKLGTVLKWVLVISQEANLSLFPWN